MDMDVTEDCCAVFGGVLRLRAPARHREKLGHLFMVIVGSGCARSRITGLGLVGSDMRVSRGLEGLQAS